MVVHIQSLPLSYNTHYPLVVQDSLVQMRSMSSIRKEQLYYKYHLNHLIPKLQIRMVH